MPETRKELRSLSAPKKRPAPGASLVVGGQPASLCDLLDRVLRRGVVVSGDITISVAGIDLMYLGLQVVLTSVDTLMKLPPADPLRRAAFEGSSSGR